MSPNLAVRAAVVRERRSRRRADGRRLLAMVHFVRNIYPLISFLPEAKKDKRQGNGALLTP